MREIKFRIWSEDDKTYSFFDFFNLESTRHHLDGIEDYYGATYLDLNPNYLQQYTGMKDRNGKDIYEGDILQWTSKFKDTDIPTPPKRGQVKYNQQGCVYHINYEMNGKHYYKDLMATFGGEVYVMETVEIVGNVFDNSELLNFCGEEK